ncbi:50S ribosomal protein L35 [Chengkuizengella sp. SCS-71B]|uniref:Large ribosomal subunit protein bL35 n=1 Tax=Chengkuizengella marina TaxID=2507566 RepID=A0A6N9Q2W7_9BACL|nr:50S ribosomal protein L35 [Chengkuizengella marina]NBI29149.1 50S ribosomal protein L35 [Chengkuizengella marina]
MPKMKTHSSLKGRFKVTGTGKIKRHKRGKNHLLAKKSGRQKNLMKTQPIMAKGDVKRLAQQLSNLK